MLDGRLALTTPEGVRLLMTPAGPYVRALAWGIDVCIFALLAGVLAMILPGGSFGNGIYLFALFFVYWGYPILCEVYWHGRTVGKRALGLEVVRSDGLPVGWRESALRNLLLVADFMPALYATGLVTMMIDPRFRRVGDIVAGTQVIYRERDRARAEPADAPALALPFPLSADQQRTLTDLFEREAHLGQERMAELGAVAEPLTGTTGADSVERMRGYVAGLNR